jgi:hypothetical protein
LKPQRLGKQFLQPEKIVSNNLSSSSRLPTLIERKNSRRALPLWAKIILAGHFPLILVAVNYFAPLSKFQTERLVGAQIESIVSGLAPIPRAQERALRIAYLEKIPTKPKVAAWGSSRGLSVNAETALTPNFVNLSASYGVLFDLAGIYSILDRTNKFPDTMIMALDGWMLSDSVKARHWTDYGQDVVRGLELIGMVDVFASEMQGSIAEIKKIGNNIAYLFSPVIFRANLQDLIQRVKQTRSLAGLKATVNTRPIDREKDGWDRDLSYWYPCIPVNDVRDRAARWGTDKETAGEKLLEGDFAEISPVRVELLTRLLTAIRSRGVRVVILLSPMHPLTYSDMQSTPARRATLAAEKTFHTVARELNIPIFGASDPKKVGLEEKDFCTDAIHVQPEVLKKVFDFTGLTEFLGR